MTGVSVLTNPTEGAAAKRCDNVSRRPDAAACRSVPGVYAGFIHGFYSRDAFDKCHLKTHKPILRAWLGELLPLIEKGLLAGGESAARRAV